MRKPTPTEKKIAELKDQIAALGRAYAEESVAQYRAAPKHEGPYEVTQAMREIADQQADAHTKLDELEKFAAKAARRNAAGRMRNATMRDLGMTRTAGGWE